MRFLLIAILLCLPMASWAAERRVPKSSRILELQINDEGTFFVLEEATSGGVPVRFLSSKKSDRVTHMTAVMPEVADKWSAVIKAEVVGVKPLKCPHPRKMFETKNGREIVVEFCPGDYQEARRTKLQKVTDEMRSHLANSMESR